MTTDAAIDHDGISHPFPTPIGFALDADRTAVVVLGLDGTPLTANRSALELLGARSIGHVRPNDASHEMLRSLLDHAPRHLADGSTEGTWHGDIDFTAATGEQLVYRATVVVGHGVDTEHDGFIAVTAHDVSHARAEAARLRHRASHDPLTGLANRRQILATLAAAVSRQRDRSGHVAVVFIDLDRLKYVNDALGHRIGDQLLVAAARRLADTVRPQDHVARIGGDEFVVICSDVADDTAALEIAERARRSLTGRLRLRQLDLQFSVSIGVALSHGALDGASDGTQASGLISDADTAMYEAKRIGRGRCVMFTPEMRTATRERTALGVELSSAIDHQHLSVEYQPIFSAVTRSTVGAEALVRWCHPDRGRVEPAEFVEIAEQSGTIGKLGQFVLEQALFQTRRWLEHGMVDDEFAVHVNVSPVQLASASFVKLVVGLLRQHGLRPEQLVLEAREAALFGRNDDVDRSVQALRRIGVRVAIDNFGTGANALSVRTEVGADILKLDGTFGRTPGTPETDTRLVRAVVVLAHALGMRVVAERVSSAGQLQRLRSAGCDMVQGNLLAPAAPSDALVTSTEH